METSIKCEECNVFGTTIEDSKSGDFVCTNCGVVSQQSFIFHQHNPSYMSVNSSSINKTFEETLEMLKESEVHIERCVSLYRYMKNRKLMKGTISQNVISMLYLTKKELGIYEDITELCKLLEVDSKKVQLLLNHYQREYCKYCDDDTQIKTIQNLINLYGKQCSVKQDVMKKAFENVYEVIKLEKSSRMHACILLGCYGENLEQQLAKVSSLQKTQIKKSIEKFKNSIL